MKRTIAFVWIMLVLSSNGGHIASGLQPGLLTNFTRVRALALHSDGQTLAIGGRYNDQPGIWFYNLITENVTGIPTGGNVSSLFWQPNGNIIAAGVSVGEGRTIQIFDGANSTLLLEFDSESSRKQVLWSSDGSQFMTPASYRAFRRDGSTGLILQTFTFPETNRRTLTGIAWSETHQRLYGALDVDRELLVWDTNSGDLLPSIEIPFVSWGPQLNHAGDLLAIGSNEGDGRVLVLDVVTGAVILDFVTEGGRFIGFGPVWSPDDSKLAIRNSTNEPNPIWIWDVETGKPVNSIPIQQSASSEAMVWSGDSKSLIVSDGEVFPIWVTPPTADAGPDQTLTADTSGFVTVTLDGSGSFDPDGEIISYVWTLDDVEIATGAVAEVQLGVGVHEITLTVTDNDGATASDTVTITVVAASTPTPTATSAPTNTPTATLTPSLTPTPFPTCTVTVAAGDALGLVSAINAANNNGTSADTICLEEGTYTFLSASNAIALPSITTPITIVGNGAIIERGSGAPNFRLFNATSSGALTLEDLTLRNGNASGNNGGAILNAGSLTLNGVTLANNSARFGGGIHSSGSLVIRGSTLVTNSAVENGGAVYVNSGTLALSDTTLESSSARYGSGVYLNNGTADLTGVIARANHASAPECHCPGALFLWVGQVNV